VAKPFAPQVVTANRLRVGDVVYLAANDDWVFDLARATVATTPEGLASLEGVAAKAVAQQQVVGVYAIDVDVTAGAPKPLSVKEHIRAAGGPTI
jgi:Protein of unknown function (DUF2849)